ncbi:type VII secretion protein EccE [Mycobacterium sp. smrl_JER01]|uniref:type VII secretion protein EccE n=1 Tax=Mycobacterium sp. smrl_JER01 TaxID=3402633 RepID=UPI003AD775E4
MTVRLTLAALFAVAAAMAYPWQSVPDRWLLGVSVAVVIVLFARWRGAFLTTVVGRRLAMLLRRGRIRTPGTSDEYATVTLRIEPRMTAELPLDLAAGYLDRYGISFDKVRITSRDVAGTGVTWVGLTLGAADNVAALSARSARIPLRDTAELAGRRLADHLREAGWEVVVDDTPDAPVSASATERWRGVDDGQGFLVAYRITVDERLDETLSAVRAADAAETWTVVEFTGSRTRPALAAVCVLRTSQRPGARAPLAGLTPEHGRHAAALAASAPGSHRRLLGAATPIPLSRT